MPRIDFDKVDDVQDFSPLPEGKYFCRLTEVEEASTQFGDEMWKLRFAVAAGQYQGRYIFDNMVFSDAALKRVKLICSRLGINASGQLDLKPSHIKGRTCNVTVEVEEYEDNEGKTKKRNVVPFAGYERADESDADTHTEASENDGHEDDGEEGLPF
jgi:hypothetical protein